MRIFYVVRWHLLDIFHHLSSLPFVSLHSNNFRKIELLLGLTQLIMPKVVFREELLAYHFSVIALWNRDEKIYRMGWLGVIFSDLRRHGGQLTIFLH